jgi:hypothetical protein
MAITTKTDQVKHLIEGAGEAIKGHDRKRKRKQVLKPWHVEARVRDDASEFWKRVYSRRGTDWYVSERYKSEREALDNCAKKTRELGRTLEYRVQYKPEENHAQPTGKSSENH